MSMSEIAKFPLKMTFFPHIFLQYDWLVQACHEIWLVIISSSLSLWWAEIEDAI